MTCEQWTQLTWLMDCAAGAIITINFVQFFKFRRKLRELMAVAAVLNHFNQQFREAGFKEPENAG